MHDVFVSYASRDHVFVDRLTARLKAEKTRFWRDIFDTDYSELQAQITEAVRNCVIFLFVISPDSLRSQWCQQELSLARSYSKRIICVMRRMPDPAQLEKEWEANPQKTDWLENCAFVLNQTWVNFRKKTDPAYEVDYDPVTRKVRNPHADGIESDEADFEEGALDLLHKMTIIPEDEKWRRKWELDARDWTNATDPKVKLALLLRGDELKKAEEWLTRTRVLSPEIGPFIAASQKERTYVKRRNRTIGGVFGAVLIGLVVLGIIGFVSEQFRRVTEASLFYSEASYDYTHFDYARAEEITQHAVDLYETSPLSFQLVDQISPDDSQISDKIPYWYRQLASSCLMTGDFTCASVHFQHAINYATEASFDTFYDYAALGQAYLLGPEPNIEAAETAFAEMRALVPRADRMMRFFVEYLAARAYLRADFERRDYAAVISRYESEVPPQDYLHDELMPKVTDSWDLITPRYLQGYFSPFQQEVDYMLAVSYEETLPELEGVEAACPFWHDYVLLGIHFPPLTRTVDETERSQDAYDRFIRLECFDVALIGD